MIGEKAVPALPPLLDQQKQHSDVKLKARRLNKYRHHTP
ncbi:hypothetical protein SynMVIR181_01630 [Synechococcus sp. MVIR-18-1]|nr:hypothetical protein SynMVIR181_01630 [Synechococcus sp. MVIR-18-1]